MNNFEKREKLYIEKTDKALQEYLDIKDKDVRGLTEAMNYSVSVGGKRIRPVLMLEMCRMCGGDYEKALPFACALEMIHTSSLIHDDMPCMDNDSMRRGKPACHVKYGENTALLAGDALNIYAFSIMSESDLPPETVIRCIRIIADATGPEGMLGGQMMDEENERSDSADCKRLEATDLKKTGALIRAACEAGAVIGGGSREEIEAAVTYGNELGIAFQIQDDILDVTGDEKLLGKTVGSDRITDKSTYTSLLGLEKARDQAAFHSEKAEKALDIFSDNEYLLSLVKALMERDR